MRTSQPSLVVALFVVCVGCYSPAYRDTVHVFGSVDLERDEQISVQAEKLAWDGDYRHVRMLIGTTPEGIGLAEGGTQIVVAPGYEDRYAVLGSASSELPFVRLQAIFWYASMHDSEGTFLPAWCSWQAPLRALTLGLWSIVPLNYPCFPSVDPDPRLHAIELRRMASAMGGNLVIIVESKSIRVSNQYGSAIAQHDDVSMTAYVLSDKGAAASGTPSTER